MSVPNFIPLDGLVRLLYRLKVANPAEMHKCLSFICEKHQIFKTVFLENFFRNPKFMFGGFLKVEILSFHLKQVLSLGNYFSPNYGHLKLRKAKFGSKTRVTT